MRSAFLTVWFIGLSVFAAAISSSPAAVFQETGTFGSANLSLPLGVTLDAQGNFYVADLGTQSVKVFDPAYNFTGTRGSGTLTTASNAVVAPNGTLYVADSSRIVPMTTAGVAGTPFGTLSGAFGIAASSTSNVFVADTGNNRVQVFSSAGALQLTLTSANSIAFNRPYGVAVDLDGNIYVADTFNNRVAIFNAAGSYQSSFSTVIPSWSDMHPKELVVAPNGVIYMSLGDPGFAAFSKTGQLLDTFGGLDRAAGVALSGNTLYGVELGKHVVHVFQVPEPSGIALCGLAVMLAMNRRRGSSKEAC